MNEFEPTMYYKCPGAHKGPKGTSYGYKGVSLDEEAEALLASGWFKSLAEAVDSFLSPPNDEKKEEVDTEVVIDVKIEEFEEFEDTEDAGAPNGEVGQDNQKLSLLDQFNENPRHLSKVELKQLGGQLDLKLTMNHSEATMASKIKEALS